MKPGFLSVLSLCIVFSLFGFNAAQSADDAPGFDLLDDDFYQEEYDQQEEGDLVQVNDPLEPMNRVFFEVNDRLYYWIFVPVRNGYSAVLPYDVRYVLGNFFHHIASPIRFLNNVLQGDFEDAGVVAWRFVINTTMGVWGFGDPAEREFGINSRPADLGQTLGKWGVGEGVYFYWPVVGPSTVRDTVGLFGDGYVHPLYFSVTQGLIENSAYYIETRVNFMSLQQQDLYDEMKRISIDPYVAMRQAYYDYRRAMITDKK